MTTLYHASPHKNLTIIKPQHTKSKDTYIGDFVFATLDRRLAAMYLATKGKGKLLDVEANKPKVIICSTFKDYLKNDKGGAIYTLPSKTFSNSPQTELMDSEIASKVAVKPLSKKVYDSSIKAMEEEGIEVYFVSKKTFDEMLKPKRYKEIISSLTPFSRH